MSETVIVSENGQGRYQQTIVTGQHTLCADEPVSMGGADVGPAPFDLVLAGLGACTSMTLRMYAERKGLPLTGVQVTLSHDKTDHDGIQRDRIVRHIRLDGELTTEQRERMVEIAGRCPVARLLAGGSLLESTLSD